MFSSAFIKGHSHLKCDDYAIHSDNCAFLSDGCSGSPNSDIGAKIVPYAAMQYMKTKIFYDFEDYFQYMSTILKEKFPNTYDIFDCTIGGLYLTNYRIHIGLLGDGIIYIKFKDGSVTYRKQYYAQNTPFYMSYLLSEIRKQLWESIPNNMLYTESYDSLLETAIIGHSTRNIFFKEYHISDINFIAIFSDGPEQVNGMELKDVLIELTDFKNFNGDFAWRRLKRFEETKKKQSILCRDDISMVIYKNEN